MTKNADIDRYHYSGYAIGFDIKGSFSFPVVGLGQNVMIFGADMSSSVHVDNKGKDTFILGAGPTQRLFEHSFTAAKRYSINFTVTKINFALDCIAMEQVVISLLMVQKFTSLKEIFLK